MSTQLGIIGTGYLGATHAVCMAELGFNVVAYDSDPAKVAALGAGELPFFEPDLPELLRKHTATGRLRFTASLADVVEHANVHFICVGTPQRLDGMAADTSQVFDVVEATAPLLTQPVLLIGKSTVPVGTAAQLAAVAQRLAPPGVHVELAWNPEFLREGQAVADTLLPNRLVFGVASTEAEKVLRHVYEGILARGVPVVVTDLVTAELAKVAANAFLAAKISFANSMADLCDATGGDVRDLAEIIGHDQRIGPAFLKAGLGYGGGCLPKDIRALMARGEELGLGESLAFLREVDATNTRRRQLMVEMAFEECDGIVTGRQITVLGAAFKPQTDDVRDSPALHVAEALHLAGAKVVVYDPEANANAARAFPALTYRDSVEDAVRGAHLVLHLTEWPEFAALEPRDLRPLAAQPRLIDGRISLDPDRWVQAGWSYRAPGRPMVGMAPPPVPVDGISAQRVAGERSETRASYPRTRHAETK